MTKINGPGGLLKKPLIIVILVAVVVGLVAGIVISNLASAPTPITPGPSQNTAQGLGSVEQTPLPEEIAGLRLHHFSQGEEALAQIAELHGKKFNLKNGYVAHYKSSTSEAMLWISESFYESEAQELIGRMLAKIKEGKSPFSGLTEFQASGQTIYSLTGLGQTHYIYQERDMVVWLAVDPPIAEQALKETLAQI